MGVQSLWSLLNATDGVVQKLEGKNGQHKDILDRVQGRAVAVDLSVWLMQAMTQQATEAHFSDDARAIKVVFERTINWLRYGLTPVAVTEGLSPAEKLAVLQARCLALTGHERGNTLSASPPFLRQSRLARRLLHAMGLPTMEAPGEAEATAAALNATGHVDAVATPDGDALLFGTRTLFHTLKLQTINPLDAVLRCCEADDICKALGCPSDAAISALTVVALLCGGDYDEGGGADNVGPRLAFAAVRLLLARASQEGQGAMDVLELLEEELQRPADGSLQELSQCRRCKRCGHDGHRKAKIAKHSARNRCNMCPATEDGLCSDRTPLPAQCNCRFCASRDTRTLARVLKRIRATPDFLERARTAQAAYERQADEAAEAVAGFATQHGLSTGQKLSWLRRPDVTAVHEALDAAGLQWEPEVVRRKLCPLLLEWDARHPSKGAEFRPVEIKGVQRQRGESDEGLWRYLMVWQRIDDECDEGEADTAWLKDSISDARCARMSVIQQTCPSLVASYHQRQQEKERKAAAAAERKAKKAAVPPQTSTIDSFFKSVKDPTRKKASGSQTQPGGSQTAAAPAVVGSPRNSSGPPGIASPSKKQRTPTKPVPGPQQRRGVADLFACATAASGAAASAPVSPSFSHDQLADQVLADMRSAAPAVALEQELPGSHSDNGVEQTQAAPTPHLSGRFGSMAVVLPAAKAPAQAAAAPQAAAAAEGELESRRQLAGLGSRRLRKQLFTDAAANAAPSVKPVAAAAAAAATPACPAANGNAAEAMQMVQAGRARRPATETAATDDVAAERAAAGRGPRRPQRQPHFLSARQADQSGIDGGWEDEDLSLAGTGLVLQEAAVEGCNEDTDGRESAVEMSARHRTTSAAAAAAGPMNHAWLALRGSSSATASAAAVSSRGATVAEEALELQCSPIDLLTPEPPPRSGAVGPGASTPWSDFEIDLTKST